MSDSDRLPMANVNRIVTTALPKDSAVAKEARVAISACATVFVHYITELAVLQCDKRKKVTLQSDDILEAIREAEFSEFEEPLKQALEAFRSSNATAKKPPAKKQKLNDDAGDADETLSQATGGGQDTPMVSLGGASTSHAESSALSSGGGPSNSNSSGAADFGSSPSAPPARAPVPPLTASQLLCPATAVPIRAPAHTPAPAPAPAPAQAPALVPSADFSAPAPAEAAALALQDTDAVAE